jgi:hypothetical protein
MQGTHKQTTGTSPTITFKLTIGVALYSGFVGTEMVCTQCNLRSTLPP